MLRLAVPVVLAELGWMAMGVVDTLMVGPLGPEAIGAVGIGSSLFTSIVIFAMGLLLGLDTLVSQAFGGGRVEECHRWLLHGVAMSVIVALPAVFVLLGMAALLSRWGLDAAVLPLTQPYLQILTWSVVPLVMYATFRRYLQGMHVVRPVMVALVAANVINAFMNWVLIYGHLGAPAMGVPGSAWATVIARVAMAAYLLVVIIVRERGRRPGLF
jgi:MATE family multidrug resistance protein